MNQIKCPKCGEVFQIDETSYESIVKQVKDHEFHNEIQRREKEFEEKINSAIELTKTQTAKDNQQHISELEKEIINLKALLENKDAQNQLVTKNALEEANNIINEKDKLINELNIKLEQKQTESELEITKAVSIKDQELMEIKAQAQAMKDNYESKLSDKDEQLAYYKDFKARQSTKMIGENLEQHCLYEFNRVRPLFKNAYFEKDNDASRGSKGDFIFRDYDDDNTEIVSIMFEMKNEADETSTKHKNEDFLAKLDKDRKEKKCEYAILVSLLEMDNDLYNEGIVDMSHRYEKMYVIRPQHFIPIITLLRNANLNSLDYKKQLIISKQQDLDLNNFEENINNFKDAFGKNYTIASKKFNEAITEIEKTIDHLNKVKDALTSSNNQLRLANDKAQDLNIKKLTKNAPSVLEKINNSKQQ